MPMMPTAPRTNGRSTTPGSSHPDPVGGLRFQVDVGQIGGVTIGAFAECTGMTVEYEVMEWKEGGNNAYIHKLRGRAKFPNLVLKRGITHEKALLAWFFDCQEKTDRHEIVVSLLGPNLKPVRSWAFKDAFPVKWTGPALNARSNDVATETLEIAHHGFARPS